MKIAIAAPTSMPARRANTIQVMKMAQAFTRNNHEVTLLVPEFKPEIKSKNMGSTNWEYLSKHYGIQTEFPIQWLSTSPAFRHYDYAIEVIRWIRKNRMNLVYTRMPQVAALASTINQNTILEIHDLPSGRFGPRLFKWFLKGKGALRLVVITRSLLTELGVRFDLPTAPLFTIVAPDGVDLDRYVDLPGPKIARKHLMETRKDLKYLSPDKFTAGYTGHLYAGRGINLITRVAVNLPEVNFLIAGGEPEQIKQLKKFVISQEINNIFIAGFVPNAELALYQAACEALIMPYQYQVAASSGGDISKYLSPMKLFEYMACGRVILASDLPVLGEVLNSKNSVLLPADRVDKWTEALIGIKENPARWKQLAETAHQQSKEYSWESRAAKILDKLEL